jgi:GNAT superfamily N-acetyltransferase
MVHEGNIFKADVRRLADLHFASLPKSVFSLLGQSSLIFLYKTLSKSRDDIIFVVRHENTILGAAVLSYSSNKLMRRVILSFPLRMSLIILMGFVSSSPLRKIFVDSMARNNKPLKDFGRMPELAIIYTDPSMRSQKVGAHLLEKIKTHLKGPYFAKTENHFSNRAISFYKNNGFQLVGISEFKGKEYCFFQTTLT